MTFWKLSTQELRHRPGRTVLTTLSIVIGVTAIVAVGMAITTARTAFDRMYRALASQADLVIEAKGGGRFSQAVVKKLEAVPGVDTAAPLMRQNAQMYVGGTKVRLLLIGVDPKKDEKVRDYSVVAGRFFAGGDEVMLEAGLAEGLSVKVNDEVRFLTREGLQQKKVVGLLSLSGEAAFTTGSVAYWPLAELQAAFRADDKINAAFLTVRPETPAPTVQQAVQKELPPELEAVLAASQTGQAKDTLRAVQLAMVFAAALSVAATGFVTLNTFLMNVSERRRTVATLRAVGATRGDVHWLLLREGLLLALIGSPIGLGLGYLAAIGVVRAMGAGFQVELPPPQLSIWWVVAAVVLGLVLVTISVLYPARRATAIAPLEVLRRDLVAQTSGGGGGRGSLLAGLATLVVAIGLIVAQVVRGLPIQVGVSGVVLVLVAAVLLLPLLMTRAVRGAAVALRPTGPVIGPLAEQQLLRHRTRTQLTWTILFIAVAGAFTLGNVLMDVIGDVHSWFDQTIRSDYIIRVSTPGEDVGDSSGMPLEVAQRARDIPGVTKVVGVRFFPALAGEMRLVAIARQFHLETGVPLAIRNQLPGSDVRAALLAGEIALGAIAAQQLGVGPGDSLDITSGGTTHKLRVAVTCSVYAMGGHAFLMNYDSAKRLFGVDGADALLIDAPPGPANPEQALRQLTEEQGAILQSYQDFARHIDGLLAGVIASLWGLLALGFMIALFGIVNTLTMNVLEQTQEIGLLRVVGLTRAQVRRLVLAQAAVLAILALVPGLILGYVLGQVLRSTALWMVGEAAQLTNRPLMILAYFAAVLALIVGAGWFPARHAARVPLLAAIRRE